MEKEQKGMTIFRALTRIDSISEMLTKANRELAAISVFDADAWIPKFGTANTCSLQDNRKTAKAECNRLYKKIVDLRHEQLELHRRISLTNAKTVVEIRGVSMTISQWLFFLSKGASSVFDLANYVNSKMTEVTNACNRYNENIKSGPVSSNGADREIKKASPEIILDTDVYEQITQPPSIQEVKNMLREINTLTVIED